MINFEATRMQEAEMRDRLAAKNGEIAHLLDLTKKLAEFAQWALHEGSWNGYDLDGGDIQQKAVALGLLVTEPYDPTVHGESEYEVESGEDWHVWSDEMKSLLEHARQEHGSDQGEAA